MDTKALCHFPKSCHNHNLIHDGARLSENHRCMKTLTFPPGTQRPSCPPPASPGCGADGSPGIFLLLQHLLEPPQPPLTMPLTPSNTPQPLSLSLTSPQGSSKLKRKQVWTAPACLETKIWRTASQRRSSGTGPLLLAAAQASRILVC